MKSRGYTILILGALALTGCDSSCAGKPQEKIALKMPTGTPRRPQGSAALTVRAGDPPFTRDDVVTYFKTHQLPKSLGSPDQVTVENLEFLTSDDVTKRLDGASTGLAATDRVAFVTLSGVFIFTGPQTKPAQFRRAYAVFDAVTGNLLMVGTLEEGRRPG
jgi:hypothetical protein